LTMKLLNKGFLVVKLKSSFQKLHGFRIPGFLYWAIDNPYRWKSYK
jgi:hypothetical protein